MEEEGPSLWQTLFNDKLNQALQPHISMKLESKYYMRNLKLRMPAITDADDNSMSDIEVVDNTVEPDDALLNYITSSAQKAPSRDKLISYLNTAAWHENQTDVAGMLAHGLSLKPRVGGSQQDLCLAICQWVRTNNIDTVYPTEWKKYKRHASNTLVKALSDYKADGWTAEDFWDTQLSILAYFIEHAKGVKNIALAIGEFMFWKGIVVWGKHAPFL